ncbi:hypothetical protein Sjap_013728 [Stephania japonica]|uniref:Uncharacterized protein n=1 Tax=Stephania japonica TaxID=461633 RepID=A0AAP0J0Z6_9MAGN
MSLCFPAFRVPLSILFASIIVTAGALVPSRLASIPLLELSSPLIPRLLPARASFHLTNAAIIGVVNVFVPISSNARYPTPEPLSLSINYKRRQVLPVVLHLMETVQVGMIANHDEAAANRDEEHALLLAGDLLLSASHGHDIE